MFGIIKYIIMYFKDFIQSMTLISGCVQYDTALYLLDKVVSPGLVTTHLAFLHRHVTPFVAFARKSCHHSVK